MIKAVLVDDEILVLNLLKRIITEIKDIQIIGAYTDPEQALLEIPTLAPDVVFLDVDMPALNGIELGTKLIESDTTGDMSIVFVTAYEQYAIHAFKLNAVHYILKPADPDSVIEVVNRLNQKREQVPAKVSESGKINCFGPMHMRVNGHKIDFLTAKVEELLALLIMHRDKGISKWRIIDVLWEEASIEKSQQNLYTMMFRLKKTLRHAGILVDVKSKNGIYRIVLDDVHCDLVEFDNFVEKKPQVQDHNLAEFERVIALYQGELFEGKDYVWCINERERYFQQFATIVNRVIHYYRDNKCFEQADTLLHAVRQYVSEEEYGQLRYIG